VRLIDGAGIDIYEYECEVLTAGTGRDLGLTLCKNAGRGENQWKLINRRWLTSHVDWALAITTHSVQAVEAAGSYTRPNGDKAQVSLSGGKLYCKITSSNQAGFEIYHGMEKVGADRNIRIGSSIDHTAHLPGRFSNRR
jgi:hypothetical protein